MASGSVKAVPAELRTDEQIRSRGKSNHEAQLASTPKIESDVVLKAPSDMTPGAKKEWRRVVKLYSTCNIDVLNDLDHEVLKTYCITVDIRAQLYKKFVQDGCPLYVDKKTTKKSATMSSDRSSATESESVSEQVLNPVIRELDKLGDSIRKYAEQLALTPVGRAGYAVRTVKANKSAVEAFMDDD